MSSDAAPTLYLFGGSNGAGKTTFARAFLPTVLPGGRFLNADEIARGLSPFAVEAVAFKAGLILLEEVQGCIAAGESFGLESTLSGRTYVRMLQKAREAGYRIELHYLWLRSAALTVKRVRQRVRKGGHAVPYDDIRRRYERSIELLLTEYLSLADEWSIWDNVPRPPQLLAASALHDAAFAERLLCNGMKGKGSSSSRRKKEPEPEWLRQARAAARRMGRMVREENRRWGLPLITERNGKIIEIPA